ncbi:MAG: tagaturonate reductase [Anaerolineae bacterium]
MKSLNRKTANAGQVYREKVVQFGAGNFLRAFADWVIDSLNKQAGFAGSVVAIKVSPRRSVPNVYESLDAQDGLYHLVLTSSEDGQAVSKTQLISSVSRTVNPYLDDAAFRGLARQPEIRFIISNTTEAGIRFEPMDRLDDRPPSSFPGKLTAFLYERFLHFEGQAERGCIILPCELIEDNGAALQRCVLNYAELWKLGEPFIAWLDVANYFCNTLVDRIVPGFPHERAADIQAEIGFVDPLLVEGESYHSWIIEAPEIVRAEFPADTIGLNVKFVTDATRYRELKVRILNGAHTSMVMVGYLHGLRSVREAVEDELVGRFVHNLLYKEVLPALDFPAAEKEQMANDVLQRFKNPFLHHKLMAISLNSTAKFKARLLPSLLDYAERSGQPPQRICLAFAALTLFYKGEWNGMPIELNDDQVVLEWWKGIWAADVTAEARVAHVLRNQTIWGQDLTKVSGLQTQITAYLKQLEQNGIDIVLAQI